MTHHTLLEFLQSGRLAGLGLGTSLEVVEQCLGPGQFAQVPNRSELFASYLGNRFSLTFDSGQLTQLGLDLEMLGSNEGMVVMTDGLLDLSGFRFGDSPENVLRHLKLWRLPYREKSSGTKWNDLWVEFHLESGVWLVFRHDDIYSGLCEIGIG